METPLTAEEIDAEIRRLQDRLDELHAMLTKTLPDDTCGAAEPHSA